MFKITAKNFLTFADLEFDFNNRGLVLVQGDNQDEPLQKSNGAGKTNMVDALCWGLYGYSLKGKTDDEVVNFKAKKNCCVTVEWGDYKVTRYRKHTKEKNDLQFERAGVPLTQKSNKDTQAKIDETIGLNYKSFIKAVYFQQATMNSFADATDSEQKAIIEDILSLNMVTVAQTVAKDKVKEYQKEIEEQERKGALVNARVTDSRSRVYQLQMRSSGFEQQRKTDKTAIEGQIALLESKRTTQSTGFDIEQARKLVALAKPVAELIPGLELERKQLENLYYGQLNAGRGADSLLMNARYKAESVRKERDKHLLDLDQKICPTCGQAMPEKPKPTNPRDFDAEIRVLEAEVEVAHAKINEINKTADGYKAQMTEKDADIQSKRSLITMATQMEQKIQQEEFRLKELQVLDERIADQRNRLTEVEGRQNPYIQQLEEENAKVTIAESELKGIQDVIFDIKSKKVYYDYWVDGLGNQKLKSYIMDSVTPLLNERANYYCQFLMGGTTEIEISTQTVTAKGEVKDKFSVDVKRTNGGGYYSCSGGERKRIDICILLALQDLVASRANTPISLLIMDEVSENLDDIGVERMLELLHNITSTKGTCMYITHHPDMKAMFPNVVTVTKKQGISQVTC